MAFPRVMTADEAAGLIPDGAVVTVSSSSGLGCPDAVLAAIGRRFDASGHPRDITTLHPIAAGDMWGIKGIDHIARDGLLSRVLAGSYPSGPVLQRAAADLADGHRATASPPTTSPPASCSTCTARRPRKSPGVLTKVGLDTFVDPDREGCAMNARAAAEPIVRQGGLRRRHLAVLPDHRAAGGHHPRHHGGRARQSQLRARGRLSRPARPGARRPQQWRHRHRAGEAAGQERHAEAA